jgi:UDP-N-acetylmuramoyl-tripeptide--D-alanyl-D-alanine ligase
MQKLPLKTIVNRMNGRIVQGTDDWKIDRVVAGTKRCREGTLLWDLNPDKTVNPDLCRSNFPCAVVTQRPGSFLGVGENFTIIQVTDIRKAYWGFVDFYRDSFNIPVIGVTGTCGKTTTKEMIKHILAGMMKVNATYKSYNALFRNLGYLMDIDEHTQAAVYEMGVAYPGDLKISCRYFKPQTGIITNIGIDHLQGFGSLEAYTAAKAELMEGLGFQGTLILNADDQNIKRIDLRKYHGKILYFGLGEQSHFKASNITREEGFVKFILGYEGQTYPISIQGHGEFNVYNAMAAIAAAHTLGIKIEESGVRLESFRNVEKHFEIKAGIGGSTVIDDTWSTNPTSAEVALKLLKSLSRDKKSIAVLGKMALLGRESAQHHYKIGEKAALLGIDRLIAMGEGAEEIGHGALKSGMNQDDVYLCQDSAQTWAVLKKILDGNSVVLVKTSMLSSYADLLDKIILQKTGSAGR